MKYPRLLLLLCLTFLVPHLASGAGYGVQISADIPGVAIFLDNSYIGDTPGTIPVLEEGVYQVGATAPGYPAQVKNVTITASEHGPVFFSFGHGPSEPDPDMLKNSNCAQPPEKAGISGTSISVVTLPDGDMMAYYSGRGEGIQCAGSADGSRWYEYPQGCMVDTAGGDALPLSAPWVYAAEDGGYRMIYLSGDMAGPSLFRAFSVDGKRFTPDGEVIIHHLSEQETTLPEQKSIPTGIRIANGSLRMYYSPVGGGIKSAVSTDDGKTWTEEEGYRLESATDPSVIILPDGRLAMFFVDLSAGSKGQNLRIASSVDGIEFSPSEPGIMIESDQKGVWILDPDVHVLPDGKWMLFFSVMGTPGEKGITVPTVMKTVLDPACLMTGLNQTYG